jgi:Polysaccharide lyase
VKRFGTPLLIALLVSACSHPAPTARPAATAIWTADAATSGLHAWHGLQGPPGRLSVVNDPEGLLGEVYLAHLRNGDIWSSDGKARAEFYGSELPDGTYLQFDEGDDYYVGWRSMINPGIYAGNGNAGELVQFKGDSDCGGPAVGVTIENGHVTLRSELYGIFWRGPRVSTFAGSWHSFVVHIHFSTRTTIGFVELWFDGARQTFTDGTQHHVMGTMCPKDTGVYLKMGYYRGTKIDGYGAGYHWIDTPRVGTSYSVVVPRSTTP